MSNLLVLQRSEQSSTTSKTVGSFQTLQLFLVRIMSSPFSLPFLALAFWIVTMTITLHQNRPRRGERGLRLRTALQRCVLLGPVHWPPRALLFSDTEGQWQLRCPSSLFLLDLLAPDLKLQTLWVTAVKQVPYVSSPSAGITGTTFQS